MRQFGPRRAVRKHARTDRNTHLGEAVVRAGEGGGRGGGGGDVEGDGEQRGGGGEGGAGRSEVEQPPPQRSPPRRRARGPHLAPQGHLIRLAKPRAERIPSRLRQRRWRRHLLGAAADSTPTVSCGGARNDSFPPRRREGTEAGRALNDAVKQGREETGRGCVGFI
jgi:hypothetical protein